MTVDLSCRLNGFGGAGWDNSDDIETAKSYPTIESSRISVVTDEVDYGTFKREFNTVFEDFPNGGKPISNFSGTTKTQIGKTQFTISYENFILKIYRN